MPWALGDRRHAAARRASPWSGCSRSPQRAAADARRPPPTFAEVQAIVDQRCQMCHDAQVPSKNVRLDTPEAIAAHAQAVYQQVVVLKLMPMNNATQITDAERAAIGRWFEAGAPPR